MKITQVNLKIFRDGVHALLPIIERLDEASDTWLRIQHNRDRWGIYDPEYARIAREDLELALDKFREHISYLYDFQHEKGLVDIGGLAVSSETANRLD